MKYITIILLISLSFLSYGDELIISKDSIKVGYCFDTGITFLGGKDELNRKNDKKSDRLEKFLDKHPNISIEIQIYSDIIKDSSLAYKRLEYIYKWKMFNIESSRFIGSINDISELSKRFYSKKKNENYTLIKITSTNFISKYWIDPKSREFLIDFKKDTNGQIADKWYHGYQTKELMESSKPGELHPVTDKVIYNGDSIYVSFLLWANICAAKKGDIKIDDNIITLNVYHIGDWCSSAPHRFTFIIYNPERKKYKFIKKSSH